MYSFISLPLSSFRILFCLTLFFSFFSFLSVSCFSCHISSISVCLCNVFPPPLNSFLPFTHSPPSLFFNLSPACRSLFYSLPLLHFCPLIYCFPSLLYLISPFLFCTFPLFLVPSAFLLFVLVFLYLSSPLHSLILHLLSLPPPVRSSMP